MEIDIERVEIEKREIEELRGRRVALARRRADDAVPRLGREQLGERRASLVRADHDHLSREPAAHVIVEVDRDRPEVILRKLVDVPLEAGLRPTSLVVPARLLFR